MPLKIIRQDITKIACDAIVNPTNEKLYPTGGTDFAIHTAAGKELYEYCRKLGGCKTGSAVITPGFKLPCKYVIHTASPKWHFMRSSYKRLEACYKSCLELALANGCESVAFPLIGSGINGFSKKLVLKCATNVISEFLFKHEMTVYLVVFDKNSYEISKKVFSGVLSYVDDNYTQPDYPSPTSFSISMPYGASNGNSCEDVPVMSCAPTMRQDMPAPCQAQMPAPSVASCRPLQAAASLEDMLNNMDKGFAETLFYYIDKKGMTDIECYKKSNVDKKTFSKIKCNKEYKPSKITAVSFAVGLRLNLMEAEHLLGTVGMCLSHSQKFDVIIEYFLKTGNYRDIFEINEVLYKFDQMLLGV